MTEIFYDQDADLSLIQGKKVAVIGYGSQGHAHALNLRDSGVEVVVGLKDGSKSIAKAEEQGFTVKNVADASAWADVIVILAPDQHQRGLYAADIKDNLEEGNALVFGHGFNIRFGYIEAPEGVDVLLVAPKGPGHTVRREYEAGRGVPVIVAAGTGAVEALGVTVGGERPGMVVPAADPEALSRTLRRWLSDGRYRSHLRTLALSRRDALDGWDVTAERMRHVLSCS